MNSNQKKLQQMIKDQSLSLTDDELFLSSAYQKYQTSMAKAATGRYRQGLQVLMEWDPSEDTDVAYTDNYKIHINAANRITQSFPSRILRSESISGLNGHETGHLLYTDFTALALYLNSMAKGSFYPEPPSAPAPQYDQNLEEIMDIVASGDRAGCMTLERCASHISNILEDSYIEARISEDYPGTYKLGIELNILRMAEQMPSIHQQIDEKYQDFSIAANLILQYCRTGSVNNLYGYSGPYLDILEECIPYIDDALYSDDVRDRFRTTNQLLVFLWEYIRPLVKDMEEEINKQGEKDAENLLESILGSQIHGGAPLPSGKNGAAPKQAEKGKKEQQENPLPPQAADIRQNHFRHAQEVVQEEGNRMALAKTTAILDGNNPGITYNHQYLGSSYEKAADDIFRILNDVATEKAEAQYQQELAEELQKAADDIHYGNAHAGIHVTVNRMPCVTDHMIQQYQTIAPPLIKASRRLQATICPLLKEESEGGKMKNLQFGKRLDMHALHHEDGTYFIRNRLPDESPRLAVEILVDESGSMSCANRITHARKAAIVVYDFCKSLDIPVEIYGHSTGYGVELYSYASFDSVDASDRYRLMDMSARDGNRDGAALRFAAERLVKRPEKKKLLIIISDGQPADYGYYGTEAEADLRGIKKEYNRQGITIFAAAIGSDKENIRRIYKDGFLDITNLEDLPKNMALLVKQHLI